MKRFLRPASWPICLPSLWKLLHSMTKSISISTFSGILDSYSLTFCYELAFGDLEILKFHSKEFFSFASISSRLLFLALLFVLFIFMLIRSLFPHIPHPGQQRGKQLRADETLWCRFSICGRTFTILPSSAGTQAHKSHRSHYKWGAMWGATFPSFMAQHWFGYVNQWPLSARNFVWIVSYHCSVYVAFRPSEEGFSLPLCESFRLLTYFSFSGSVWNKTLLNLMGSW